MAEIEYIQSGESYHGENNLGQEDVLNRPVKQLVDRLESGEQMSRATNLAVAVDPNTFHNTVTEGDFVIYDFGLDKFRRFEYGTDTNGKSIKGIADLTNNSVIISGEYDMDFTLVEGTKYYASTNGNLTTVENELYVGIAKTNQILYIQIEGNFNLDDYLKHTVDNQLPTGSVILKNSSFQIKRVTNEGGSILRADSSIGLHAGELGTIERTWENIVEHTAPGVSVADYVHENTFVSADDAVWLIPELQSADTYTDITQIPFHIRVNAYGLRMYQNNTEVAFIANDGKGKLKNLVVSDTNTSLTGNLSTGNAIAIGDSDTGFRQNGNGILEAFANNQKIYTIESGSHVIHKDSFVEGSLTINSDNDNKTTIISNQIRLDGAGATKNYTTINQTDDNSSTTFKFVDPSDSVLASMAMRNTGAIDFVGNSLKFNGNDVLTNANLDTSVYLRNDTSGAIAGHLALNNPSDTATRLSLVKDTTTGTIESTSTDFKISSKGHDIIFNDNSMLISTGAGDPLIIDGGTHINNSTSPYDALTVGSTNDNHIEFGFNYIQGRDYQGAGNELNLNHFGGNVKVNGDLVLLHKGAGLFYRKIGHDANVTTIQGNRQSWSNVDTLNDTKTVTFPIAFNNAPKSVQLTINHNVAANGVITAYVYDITTTNFKIRFDNTSTESIDVTVDWLAISFL